MQKMVIKNFGPVKDCELYINDFTLFIGPQASGKSTISKCIYFFKSLRDDFFKFAIADIELDGSFMPMTAFEKVVRKKFVDLFGTPEHSAETLLSFTFKEYYDVTLTFEDTIKYVNIKYSADLLKKLRQMITMTEALQKNINSTLLDIDGTLAFESLKRRSLIGKLQEKLNIIFDDDRELVFIPSGRSLLAVLADYVQLLSTMELDYITQEFLTRISNTKRKFKKSIRELISERQELTMQHVNFENVNLAEGLIYSILKGEYRNVDGEDKVYLKSESKHIKLNYASSGQQESIWILYLLFFHILENRKAFVIIEEPEAHLFPEAQAGIVGLISLFVNSNENQVVITTHSPYILSCVNNLIYANKVGKSKTEQVSSIINPKFWLDTTKTAAYRIGGKDNVYMKDIIDKELGQIMEAEIDEASTKNNEDYYKLYYLE